MVKNKIELMNAKNKIHELYNLTKRQPINTSLATPSLNSFHITPLQKENKTYPYLDIFMNLSALTFILLCIYLEIFITPVPYLIWGIAAFALASFVFLLPKSLYLLRTLHKYKEISYDVKKSKLTLLTSDSKHITLQDTAVQSIKLFKPTITHISHYTILIRTVTGDSYHIPCDILTADFDCFLDYAYMVNLKSHIV